FYRYFGHIAVSWILNYTSGLTYGTPWVDQSVFPRGLSVLAVTDGPRMLGFLGAICAPYPRQTSYWLALWHVLPELKGTGLGGKLLRDMQRIALTEGGRSPSGDAGWIGTFGAGPEALPVYLKGGYAARAARRWVFDPEAARAGVTTGPVTPAAATERDPDHGWLEHRYTNHPVYTYEQRGSAASKNVFRTETNAWGRVTHAVRLSEASLEDTSAVFSRESSEANAIGAAYLMDAWGFECPGPGWTLAPDSVPSVFHPPEARGSVTYAVGYPFVPSRVHKGDCDQDRPNAGRASGTAIQAA
ncbi:MAG: hypothetical protein AAF235_09200, partial [Planctomycetota bacterium]